ncbi:hypothetical protein ACET3X_009020 [Alternaria dauci]|uniref:Uncharacterized protein n=1 Tax=Alternaria dauci TaxID=48095 RepID=A0ABR3U7M9_9PLEO
MVAPPLLALPGELRNRIYEFCVEPKALYIPRHPIRTKKHYAHARCGLYGSLRNVCRQTRAEFGSSYMAKNVMVLHQITANAFLKTFYPDLRQPKVSSGEPPLEHGTADSSVQGNILIMSYFGQPYDATPLARLCMKYPNFNVTFTDASACLRLAVLLDGFFANISSGEAPPPNTMQAPGITHVPPLLGGRMLFSTHSSLTRHYLQPTKLYEYHSWPLCKHIDSRLQRVLRIVGFLPFRANCETRSTASA